MTGYAYLVTFAGGYAYVQPKLKTGGSQDIHDGFDELWRKTQAGNSPPPLTSWRLVKHAGGEFVERLPSMTQCQSRNENGLRCALKAGHRMGFTDAYGKWWTTGHKAMNEDGGIIAWPDPEPKVVIQPMLADVDIPAFIRDMTEWLNKFKRVIK